MIEIQEFIAKYEAERGVPAKRIAEIQSEIDEAHAKLTLGYQLRKRREEKGLTQLQVANKVSVDRATVRQLEKGEGTMRLNVLIRICLLLDLELSIRPKPSAAVD